MSTPLLSGIRTSSNTAEIEGPDLGERVGSVAGAVDHLALLGQVADQRAPGASSSSTSRRSYEMLQPMYADHEEGVWERTPRCQPHRRRPEGRWTASRLLARTWPSTSPVTYAVRSPPALKSTVLVRDDPRGLR